jgi:glycerol-3-phosphate dehydrogenase
MDPFCTYVHEARQKRAEPARLEATTERSSMPRTTSLPAPRPRVDALTSRPSADVVVIGGGINGIATFRDLALQGVDVVLVERGDWASGASSASSHMIHGGVRYLENGEFRLVREAVQERNRLLRNARHYVHPLRTTIPIFSTFSGLLAAPLRFLTHRQRSTRERGALLIKLGLTIYDSFSRDGGTQPRHRFLGRRRSLTEMPELNPGLKYTATYFDASMHDPERLALDVLLDGIAAGGRAANYVEAIGVSSEGTGIRLRDLAAGAEFDLAARVVVNASGPWTDLTNEALGRPTRYMGGTKGSHIVLDHPELLEATHGRELFFENDDGRIVLIYPLKGRVMVGTTDIDADPREPAVCTEEEVDYFFALVHHVLPGIRLDRSQIVYRFAGIRPLPHHDDEAPGFVSRDYRIEPAELGDGRLLLSLVGGKWTTFRALAEHLTDEVLSELGVQRKVSTALLPIGGGAGFPADDAAVQEWIRAHMGAGRDADRTTGLLTRYGTRAEEVIEYLDAEPDHVLRSTGELSVRELEFMAANEQVGHLVDVFIRRTSLAFRGLVTEELLHEVAEVLSAPLGWNAGARAAEILHAKHVLQRFHRVETKKVEHVNR